MEVKCERCGAPWEHYNFEYDSTFWGSLRGTTTTITQRVVRVLAFHHRSGRGKASAGTTRVAEDKKLCSECWGLFVSEFMNGQMIGALDHE